MPHMNPLIALPTYPVMPGVLAVRFWTPRCAQQLAHMAKSNPSWRCSPQQMVTRAETICRYIVSDASELYFTSFSQANPGRNGSEIRQIGEVEYRDMDGNHRGAFWWDAETGHLLQASQVLRDESRFTGHLTSKQAATVSLYWLDKLQIAPEQTWRVGSTLECNQGEWKCEFLSANIRVHITLRASDGQLVFAQSEGGRVPV